MRKLKKCGRESKKNRKNRTQVRERWSPTWVVTYILTLNRDKIENEEKKKLIKLDISKHTVGTFTKEKKFLRCNYQEMWDWVSNKSFWVHFTSIANFIYYPLCMGHYYCNSHYTVERTSYDSYLLLYTKRGKGCCIRQV